jgi:hypothetical protein
VNSLQKKFQRFKSRALRRFGSFIEIDGQSYPCIFGDGRTDRPREDGGFFEGKTISATLFKSDFPDGNSLINQIVQLDSVAYRVEAVADQVMAQAWEIILAEPDK